MYQPQRSRGDVSGHVPAYVLVLGLCFRRYRHSRVFMREALSVYRSCARQMVAMMQRVNVVLSSLIKGRKTRQSVTNVFGEETEEKTFSPLFN